MSKVLLPEMYIEIEVKDKNNKIIRKQKEKAHSWVGNFIKALCAILRTDSVFKIREYVTAVDGTTLGLPNINSGSDPLMYVEANEKEGAYGIVIGSGDSPVNIDDYDLDTKISHGDEAGKMHYNATTVESTAKINNGYIFRIIRTFTNNSGGDITVKEIGIIAKHRENKYLIARDVLSSPVTVPNGATLTVRYIISYSIS